MPKEIERKFLVQYIPKSFDFGKPSLIWQTYLAIGEEEIRIRRERTLESESVILTIKKERRGLTRTEEHVSISTESFNQIIFDRPNTVLRKLRYRFLSGDYEFVADVYKNAKTENLIIVKVKFKSETDAILFERPEWLGEDVTDNPEYSSQRLWEQIQ